MKSEIDNILIELGSIKKRIYEGLDDIEKLEKKHKKDMSKLNKILSSMKEINNKIGELTK